MTRNTNHVIQAQNVVLIIKVNENGVIITDGSEPKTIDIDYEDVTPKT